MSSAERCRRISNVDRKTGAPKNEPASAGQLPASSPSDEPRSPPHLLGRSARPRNVGTMTAPVVVGSHDVSAVRAGHRRVHRASHLRWRILKAERSLLFRWKQSSSHPGPRGGGGREGRPWPWLTVGGPRSISSSAAACSSPWDRPVSPHPRDSSHEPPPPLPELPPNLVRFFSPRHLPRSPRRARAPAPTLTDAAKISLPEPEEGRRQRPAMGRRGRRLGDTLVGFTSFQAAGAGPRRGRPGGSRRRDATEAPLRPVRGRLPRPWG